MANLEAPAKLAETAGRYLAGTLESGASALREAAGLTTKDGFSAFKGLARLPLAGKPTADQVDELASFMQRGTFHASRRGDGVQVGEPVGGLNPRLKEFLGGKLKSGTIEDGQDRSMQVFVQDFDKTRFRNAQTGHRLWLNSEFTHQEPLTVRRPDGSLITPRYGVDLNTRAAALDWRLGSEKPPRFYLTNAFENSFLAKFIGISGEDGARMPESIAHDTGYARAQLERARALGPGFIDQLEQAHMFRIANGDISSELHPANFSAAVIGGKPFVGNIDPECWFTIGTQPAIPSLRFFQGKAFSPANQSKLESYADLLDSNKGRAIFKDAKLSKRAYESTLYRTDEMIKRGAFRSRFDF